MRAFLANSFTLIGGGILLGLLGLPLTLHAQHFVKTDIVTVGPSSYTGASWIDFNNDDLLDLFINNRTLLRNEGNGTFQQVFTDIGATQALVTGNGNTWADYDNDGDLDVYVCSLQSLLYRNEGEETFTQITDGDIGEGMANRGWSCAWADFDNDGDVDLAITHPAGFVGPATTNHLFTNDGPPNYSFTRVTSGAIVTGQAAYTVGTWSDFDLDGDMDYFVGAGPANGSTARDFLYQNQLTETGTATFARINDGVIATDLQDGQVWNWIDYDNDGDLDAYLTNWGGPAGGIANRLYRNDDGTFNRVTTGAIVQDSDISLSSVWADFDNDGDLDCYVANDQSQPDRYYQNNGAGSFTRVDTMAVAESRTRRGATAGDYDNDGDLDLLAVGPGNGIGLYRNDLAGNNHWLKIKTIGTTSNRSGIGAKVRVKATIGGAVVRQIREVLSQNTFNGQNSLDVHVGLGDAAIVDSLTIEWPSGMVDRYANVAADQFLEAVEGGTIMPVAGEAEAALPQALLLRANYPNPFRTTTTIPYDVPEPASVTLSVFDLLGRQVATLVDAPKPPGTHTALFDATRLPPGVYAYRLRVGAQQQTRRRGRLSHRETHAAAYREVVKGVARSKFDLKKGHTAASRAEVRAADQVESRLGIASIIIRHPRHRQAHPHVGHQRPRILAPEGIVHVGVDDDDGRIVAQVELDVGHKREAFGGPEWDVKLAAELEFLDVQPVLRHDTEGRLRTRRYDTQRGHHQDGDTCFHSTGWRMESRIHRRKYDESITTLPPSPPRQSIFTVCRP